MNKIFNVSADCKPDLHYMVNLNKRLKEIKQMVDRGDYFTINCARQFGKTTTLKALGRYLKNNYVVLSLDFQKLSYDDFKDENSFVQALAAEIIRRIKLNHSIDNEITDELNILLAIDNIKLSSIFEWFSSWCEKSDKPIVLIIDEIDSAANNQVFLDFLSFIRGYYIERDEIPTFQSVILAGVYDIKNLKRRFVLKNDEYRVNSPWNIAADFLVNMSFSAGDIEGMLTEYDIDYKINMNISEISNLIYDYTSGYPYLVSRICKLMDERIAGSSEYPDKKSVWKKEGVIEAVKIISSEKNTLFESMIGKLADYPELRKLIYSLLFSGHKILYHSFNESIEVAEMFGFIKNSSGYAKISNRIFEIVLYNLFLSEEALDNHMYKAALQNKNQLIKEENVN